MPPVIRFRPGVQATDSTATAEQTRAIGEALESNNVTIDLGSGALTGRQLAGMTAAQLLAAGYDPRDLMELVDDVALAENRGTTVNVRSLAPELNVRDGVDGNYTSAIVAPDGAALSLTRHVGDAADRNWRATRRWSADEIAAFRRFSSAYIHARVDAGDRVNCADLALEILVAYARQRNLPIALGNGEVTITNDTARANFTRYVQRSLQAMHIPGSGNTVPISVGDARTGDIGIMNWDQSIDEPFGGHDNAYNHTYNIIDINPDAPWETLLGYGSLEDLMRQSVLTAFNTRFGTNFGIEDLTEHEVIDPITGDQGRGVPVAQQREIARWQLSQHGIAAPTAAQINAFIAMIQGRGNVLRDQDTHVYLGRGQDQFDSITGRDLWADQTLIRAGLRQLNATLSLRRPILRADVTALLREGTAENERAAARVLLQRRGVPAARLDAATDQLVAICTGARQLRRWNFTAWNSRVPA